MQCLDINFKLQALAVQNLKHQLFFQIQRENVEKYECIAIWRISVFHACLLQASSQVPV